MKLVKNLFMRSKVIDDAPMNFNGCNVLQTKDGVVRLDMVEYLKLVEGM